MVIFPNAKINLGLRILRKRKDGYHDLETCFYPIPYFDILEFVPSSADLFEQSGIKLAEINLVQKAISILRGTYKFPNVTAHLHKNIPAGAGLGGGSSDATHTLMGLNELFDLKISEKKLIDFANQLGKDCPFFIRKKPVIASGTGDKFEEIKLDLSGLFMAIVTPPLTISTPDAFSMIEPKERKANLKDILTKDNIPQWEEKVINDFQPVMEEKYPEIKEVKLKLKKAGAIFTSLSGTGSSVYGIFEKKIFIKNMFPSNYRVWMEKI